jgi:tetratricopeptide (TPR) repeat protein
MTDRSRDTPLDSSEGFQTGEGSEPEVTFVPGESVGRLQVLKKVGQGGMGVVYAMYDFTLRRKLAVKVLRTDRAGGADARAERMLKEGQLLAKLSHPNVVTVHLADRYDEHVFLAMEFMEGGTLREWQVPARPPREVVQMYLGAGLGLAAAHEAGLVHSDFKPENVMLDEHGVPHVTDFGLAEVLVDAGEGPRRRAGTPGYMAPEQERGEARDARADQYSFCAALYEALYRELPGAKVLVAPGFRGTTALLSAVPAHVRRALLKGLSAEPNARFPSMGELLEALSDDPAKRWRGRALLGVTALSIAAVIAGSAYLSSRESPEARAVRLCSEGANADADRIFNEGRRGEIVAAFDKVQGMSQWPSVRARLEGDVQAWRSSSLLVCRLPLGADRRRVAACLEERRKTLQSTSDMFAAADRQVVDQALNTMMLEIQPVAGCSVSGAEPPPTVSAEADERMRSGLARARVLKAAGKWREAVKAGLNVAVEAEEPDPAHPQAPQVAAETRLLLGEIYADRRRVDAEVNLLRAITFAEAVGNDEVRARAWLGLIVWYVERRRFPEAKHASDQANAISNRLGRPPLLEAARLNQEGMRAKRLGRNQEAVTAFREAVRLRREHLPEEHPLVAKLLSNLAVILPPEEGLPIAEGVLRTRLKLFGEKHPDTADALHLIGAIAMNKTPEPECETALRMFEDAIAAQSESQDLVRLGSTLCAKARALHCLNRPEIALDFQKQGVKALRDGDAVEDQLLHQLRYLVQLCGELECPAAEQAELQDEIDRLEVERARSGGCLPRSVGKRATQRFE